MVDARGHLDAKAGDRFQEGFNTEVTEILRALRVEVLIATEHTERMCMKMGNF